MKTVTVLGWYGKSNCGDESYKMAFPAVFKNYKFNFVNKITDHNSDAYILGGGDVLAPSFLNQLVNVKKPKHIISVSANEKVDPELLKGYANIFVREKQSLDILTKKGVKASYAPDVAFALSGDPVRGLELMRNHFVEQKRDMYERRIVVVINGFLAEDHANGFDVRRAYNFQDLTYKLSHVLDHTNASFVFVPFGQELPWDDRVTNMWIASKAKFWKKNLCISESNVQNVLDIISSADAIVSTRLHSTIFAMTTKTPIVDITHNHKNRWLLETVDKNHFSVNYRAIDEGALKLKINDLISNRNIHAKELSILLDKQKEILGGLSNVCLV
jgi:colanic acid/amylovoran biosynthesis protein